MKLLLTGASGFLGKSIADHLISYESFTLGRSKRSDVVCDLALEIPILPMVDIVLHVAGKAHSVPKTEDEKRLFFDVNVTGTLNLLKALDRNKSLPKYFVFISSVAVYGLEKGLDVSEEMPLNATDPYGKSKIEAENSVIAWCNENSVKCTILRLPLLVGPKPPGNLGAMIKAINMGYYFNIGKGNAKKSMVLAEDVAQIIPKAAEIGGIYNLTDGLHPAFNELSLKISTLMNKSTPLSIPFGMAKVASLIGDVLGSRAPINSDKLNKIVSDLTFNDSKARAELGWSPKSVLDNIRIE